MPRTKDEFDEMIPDADELPPWDPPFKIVEVEEPTLTLEDLAILDAGEDRAEADGRPRACCQNGAIERHLPEIAAAFRAARGDDWHRHETREEYEARLERESAEMMELIKQHNEQDRQWVETWREKKRAAARRA